MNEGGTEVWLFPHSRFLHVDGVDFGQIVCVNCVGHAVDRVDCYVLFGVWLLHLHLSSIQIRVTLPSRNSYTVPNNHPINVDGHLKPKFHEAVFAAR